MDSDVLVLWCIIGGIVPASSLSSPHMRTFAQNLRYTRLGHASVISVMNSRTILVQFICLDIIILLFSLFLEKGIRNVTHH